MPFDSRAPKSPVTLVEIKSFDFDAKKLASSPSRPKYLMEEMENILLNKIPQDASVKETKNTTLVDYNGKRLTISAWMFNTADCSTAPFKKLLREGYDVSVVLAVHFFENGKFVSTVDPKANVKYVVGLYSKYITPRQKDDVMDKVSKAMTANFGISQDEIDRQNDKVRYYASQHAIGLASSLANPAYDFFNPDDDLKAALIDKLKNYNSTFSISNETAHTFNATTQLEDYTIYISYKDNNLKFEIPHKYTDYDRVYGADYSNTERWFKINSIEDVDIINLDELMDDLYKNRNGRCIRQGSLGT